MKEILFLDQKKPLVGHPDSPNRSLLSHYTARFGWADGESRRGKYSNV